MPRPLDYQHNSEGLGVPLDGYIVGEKIDVKPKVKVYKYQNVDSNYRIEGAKIAKSRLVSCFKEDKIPPAKIGGLSIPGLGTIDKMIGSVHIGCGSYNDIRTVLQLVAYYSFRKKFSYVEGLNASNCEKKLQEYCDDCIGIDCVGFVAGFAKDIVHLSGLRGVSLDESYNLSTGHFIYSLDYCRTSVGSVQIEDVMVWETVSHIALVDNITVLNQTEASITFAESLGQWGSKTAGGHLGVHSGKGTLRKEGGTHKFTLERISTGMGDIGLHGVKMGVKIIDLI